jgi:hypothetical protein
MPVMVTDVAQTAAWPSKSPVEPATGENSKEIDGR